MGTCGKYAVSVEEVHSGDDFILLVNLGIDGLYKKTRARLYGVDAPNAYKAKSDSEAGAIRDEVKRLVLNTQCSIDLVSEGKGGWIVTLYVVDPRKPEVNVNEYLKNKGFVFSTSPTEKANGN